MLLAASGNSWCCYEGMVDPELYLAEVVSQRVCFHWEGQYLPVSASPMWSKFELTMRCDNLKFFLQFLIFGGTGC